MALSKSIISDVCKWIGRLNWCKSKERKIHDEEIHCFHMSPILLFTGNSNVVHPPVSYWNKQISHPGGDSRCSWVSSHALATIWVRVGYLHSTPSWRGCRVTGNTPDFMLEHFIVLISAGTS